ncbi:MAG: flagellar export chaperone FliS [Burkholderiales bacterium]|nr:flagellar export chaperone FliS [Burkholderiales bacterium]
MIGARQARLYAQTAVETAVPTADPHALILLLYDGAVVAIGQAIDCMQRADVPGKGRAIAKAIQIVEEGLKASLDRNSTGDLAAQLARLYDYMAARLLFANLKNEVSHLVEVRDLLCGLRDAWAAIGARRPHAPGGDDPVRLAATVTV